MRDLMALQLSTACLCLGGVVVLQVMRLAGPATPYAARLIWAGTALFVCILVQCLAFAHRIGARLQRPSPTPEASSPVADAGQWVTSGHDKLTGLAVTSTYQSWLGAAWTHAAATDGQLGLVLVDIDHFALYNDFYGRTAADACLQTLARAVREQSRDTTDHVARLGADVFAILLPGLDLTRAGDVAERVRAAIEAADLPHLGAGASCSVSASCGAASLTPGPAGQPHDLFAAAHTALLNAKRGGRNAVCLADIVAERRRVDGDAQTIMRS